MIALTTFSASAILNEAGKPVDPFASAAHARVFIFARTDCPLTHRYAPELQRIWREFSGRGLDFWMVYPDPAETPQGIEADFSQYGFPGKALRDPHHELVARARATVAPEAAVFDTSGRLVYHGRIDDQWIDFGKARPTARVHDLENVLTAVFAGAKLPETETRAVGCSLADVQ
ncbi:MAG: redoxin domain-containing protein [Acidobacteriota bacterium]|nr:redoxin domain-containing protein [Acidobacteriota bacterium]